MMYIHLPETLMCYTCLLVDLSVLHPLALGSRALLAQFDDIFFRQLRISPPIQTVQSWSHRSELSVPVPSLITRTKVQRFVVAIGGWKSQVCPIPDLRKSGAGTLVTMYSKVRLYIHMI